MILMAVESSCDETAVALVEDGRRVLTDCIASQVDLHRIYGGVVPEIASRKHIEAIYGLADQALVRAGLKRKDVDGIAVTYAPGLIGAVLVGVNFAKGAALALDVPLIPVHHIRGHIAANYLAYPELEPPFLCLVVSGGHTMLVHVRDYTDMEILGTTLDDAAGECFDKVARVLGMPYPGGAALDQKARVGQEGRYPLPRARGGENPLDMSFSGLKTAAINLIHNAGQKGEPLVVEDLCADFSAAVSDTLVPRAMEALGRTGCRKLAVAGGVAANSRIRRDVLAAANGLGVQVYMPPLALCGDNAAMIGAQGYYEYLAGNTGDMTLTTYATQSIIGETLEHGPQPPAPGAVGCGLPDAPAAECSGICHVSANPDQLSGRYEFARPVSSAVGCAQEPRPTAFPTACLYRGAHGAGRQGNVLPVAKITPGVALPNRGICGIVYTNKCF